MFNTVRVGSGGALSLAAATKSPVNKKILNEVQQAAEQVAQNWLQQKRGMRHASRPQSSTQEKLLKRSSSIASQKRQIVTAAAKQQLDTIHPSLARLPYGVPPYQKPAMCEFQAADIITYAQAHSRPEVHGQPVSQSTQEDEGIWKTLLNALLNEAPIDRTKLKSADQILQLYNKNGPFVMRAPELADPSQASDYEEHAIAVMAVVKVPIVGQGEKIVLCAIDCNDQGSDAETQSAQQHATQSGKALSELSHAEAEQHGADRRRIRLIDGDSVVTRLINYTAHSRASTHEGESTLIFLKKGAPLLSDEQTDQLKELISNSWNEVEDYSKDSYAHLKHMNFS